jgi:hypothetical protein
VPIQAYVDASGSKGQGKIFSFSALIATAEEWTAFVEEWEFCLKESPSIRYFKMYEADQRSGEFRFFSEAERDKKIKSLCRSLNTPVITQASLSIVLKDFSEKWAPRLGRPACEPYFFPFQVMHQVVGYEVLGRGEKQPFDIFFDEDVIFGPPAKAWYPIIKELTEPMLKAIMPVEPFFRSDVDILPLQAADLTAWIRRNADDLQEFEWLPEHLSLMNQSPLSRTIDAEWIEKMSKHEYSPEEKERNAELRKRYKETFGFDWPPKNKLQEKRHRGK